MMPSADQHRWFAHHPGISTTSHPDVAGLTAGAANFPAPGAVCRERTSPFKMHELVSSLQSAPGTAGPHHPAINPYMEASYIDDMHHHMEGHQGPAGYYGLNMQYRAAHQRSLSGKCL